MHPIGVFVTTTCIEIDCCFIQFITHIFQAFAFSATLPLLLLLISLRDEASTEVKLVLRRRRLSVSYWKQTSKNDFRLIVPR